MKKLNRNEIIEEIIKIYIEVVAFFDEEEKASINEYTRVAMDFKIAVEIISLVTWEIERHFSIKVPIDEWSTVATIGDIADLVIKYEGYVSRPYSFKDYKPEYPAWIKKIGYFFRWLFGKK